MNDAHALTARLTELLRREHAALAEFLVALADFDRRRLWVELGYSSLFYFLHRELRLSKGAAQYRKTAAELIQRIPAAVAPLRDGRLCLTSVVEAARVVTPENWEAVLPRFFGLSKREAREVVASVQPDPAPPSRVVVTCLHGARGRSADGAAGPATPPLSSGPQPTLPQMVGRPDEPDPSRSAAPESPRSVSRPAEPVLAAGAGAAHRPIAVPLPPKLRDHDVAPLTAEKSRLHVTVSSRFLSKLEAAKAALSHSHPGATAEDLLEVGLDLLLERVAKRRGLVARPGRTPQARAPARGGRVPAHVRRSVWTRDGGRCQWPVDSGGVCGSTVRVELDHVRARAHGGPHAPENLRLLCRLHNDLAARQAFGDRWMDRFTRGGRRGDTAPSSPRSGRVAREPPSRA